jgi:hypothetical protein
LSRFEVVVARRWDYEQLLFESPSRHFAGRAIPPMRHGNSSEASRGTGHDVAFDENETKDRPR